MNEANREHLSALSDGELAFAQARFLLRRMEQDVHLRTSWTHYHVGRECLRGEFSGPVSEGFADRVMAALDPAATIRAGSGSRRWLRWSAGGAIAAGVAAVALMVAQPRNPGDAPASAPTVAETSATTGSVVQAAPARAPEVPRWLAASPAGQLTQPASVTTLGGQVQGNALIPAAYSRDMAPYMSLRGYQVQSAALARLRARTPDGGWIIKPPSATHPAGARARAIP